METYGFLVISGGAECEHWPEMGLKYTFLYMFASNIWKTLKTIFWTQVLAS